MDTPEKNVKQAKIRFGLIVLCLIITILCFLWIPFGKKIIEDDMMYSQIKITLLLMMLVISIINGILASSAYNKVKRRMKEK